MNSSSVEIVEMDADRRERFLASQAGTYAESLFRSGAFGSSEEASERARQQLKSILAMESEEQFFFRVIALNGATPLETGPKATSGEVGVLWWTVRKPARSAWIYDIAISQEFRRRGFARAALQELEKWCRKHSCPQIGLNVFAFNSGAEKLYREMGFEDISKQMRKLLS